MGLRVGPADPPRWLPVKGKVKDGQPCDMSVVYVVYFHSVVLNLARSREIDKIGIPTDTSDDEGSGGPKKLPRSTVMVEVQRMLF